MVGEDRIMMSGKELRRVHVIRQVMEKTLTQVEAGTLLGVTDRQIRRLLRRVEQEGEHGLVHRGRGKPSNRRLAEPVQAKVLRLYGTRYGDFGPTLAAAKLAEHHGIMLSDETCGAGSGTQASTASRGEAPHRAWRERKVHVGELLQLDGSHHDWFEERGPRWVLTAYLDNVGIEACRFLAVQGESPQSRFGQPRTTSVLTPGTSIPEASGIPPKLQE